MRINYNVSAMISNNALSNSDNLLSKSLQRLSSGLKINSAKDNPAGLAMSKRMNAQIEGISVATQNASDGVSIIETADGALSEIQSMVQRMNELTVKACHGVLTDADRETIQDEIRQLKEEVTRIADSTEFNSQKLLNGEFDLKSYTSQPDVKVDYVSDDVSIQKYTIDTISVNRNAEGELEATVSTGAGFPAQLLVGEVKDNRFTISAEGGFEMTIDVSEMTVGKTYTDVEVDVTGIGAMRLQIGSNEGQILGVRIPEISLENMGIENIDVSTEAGANDALKRMPDANAYISRVRSRLGAYQNRLESSINSLDITSENMTAAYSRIMDVDMAEEMTNYTTYQVMTQAGTSMLAQANERPSQVLQLLQ
ncbi:MAG: flagellin [Lachnospiraceae bacterium]|nr:flagellin [Lachnospiraceae bacterium]